MIRNRIRRQGWWIAGVLLLLLAPLGVLAAAENVVIQYDNIPHYANWGKVTQKYLDRYGVRIPPDPKGSSASMAALEAEKANPQADCVYYSGAIGYQAAQKGLHQPYKPKGWETIPDDLKDPNGLWWTIHTATVGLIINTEALGETPIPRSWADLLKPEYQGKIAYDDPTWGGTAFTFVWGINQLLGGTSENFQPGFDYLKKLDKNIITYPRESIYNDVLRGEIPIWINADGNGLTMKWVDKGPVEVVIPTEGGVTMPLVMAMVKGAPHEKATKKYLDWLLSVEAQEEFARAFFRPINPAALSPDVIAKFPPAEQYKNALNPSLKEMAEHADQLKREWLRGIRHRR